MTYVVERETAESIAILAQASEHLAAAAAHLYAAGGGGAQRLRDAAVSTAAVVEGLLRETESAPEPADAGA